VDRSPLQLTGRGTLDAAGQLTLTVNGPPSLTRRELSTIVIQCAPATPRPQCAVYRGSIAPHRKMAMTRLGDDDTFISDNDTLESGEALLIQWTGGPPGAVAVATVNCADVLA
jgi:hypothetical protein